MKKDDLKRMTALTAFAQGVFKPRKERAKETAPRNQPERELRNEVIRVLREKHCRVYRIENSIAGKSTGIADLLIFNPRQGKWCFMELKSHRGRLQDNQRVFKDLCQRCGVPYFVCRTVEDAMEIVL